jgi:uncharacterized repeat protein (TIGR02543 family)
LAEYDIAYNLYGGTNHVSNPATYTITTATITLGTPTKTGYTFGGWYSDAEFTTAVTEIALGSTGDVTLYAKFTVNQYTLSFNKGLADGGDAPESQSVNYGENATLPEGADATMYKTGYHLEGWHAESDLSDAGYEPGSLYAMPAANSTLYAKWVLNDTRYVIFNTNGGSGTMANQGIVEGNSATLSANSFTKTGYTFAGWALTSDGAVAYANQASLTMGASNVNLYAKWTINQYTATFNSNGGSSVGSQTKDYDSLLTQPGNPTRTGYTFAGWYKETALTTAWSFTTDRITASITLYAKWTEILVTAYTTYPTGSSNEWNPYEEEVDTSSGIASYRDFIIQINNITPSTALNKTAEYLIQSGSSLIESVTPYSSLTPPYQSWVFVAKQQTSGTVKIKIRSVGNPGVAYYYEYTLSWA